MQFTDMHVWQKTMDLIEEIYLLSKEFPREEIFGMTSQIRRSTTSILANIAEGFGRATAPDKAHKYTIARGECSETHAVLLASVRLQFVTSKRIEKADLLCRDIGKMLTGLIRKYS